ncbi:MAG: CapA family protein [Gemmataceae bacterium]
MSRRFPDHFTPEKHLPAWQQLRVENLPFRDAVLNTLSYIRKSIHKKYSTHDEGLRHFAEQRQIFRHLLEQPAPVGSTRLGLVGDIMWLRDGWDSFLDRGVLDYLNAHETVLGNLESVVSRRFKVPSLFPDYFTYNSHPNLVRAFRRPDGRSTFSALSLANNHALDRGELGARDTQELLGELSIPHSGISFVKDERPYTLFEVNGIRIGFHAMAWGLNSFVPPDPRVRMNSLPPGVFDFGSQIDLAEIRRVLADMTADGCHFRVIAVHWGYEFEYYPCPGVMRVGREIVRAGADVVLGTHPHVQQPCETLFLNGAEDQLPEPTREVARMSSTLTADGPPRKALIAYSMGNLATTMFTFECKIGWILSLRLFRDGAGRIDWKPDASAFVVNVPRFGRGRDRRLLMLDDYRRQTETETHRRVPRWEEDYFSFLGEHILGNPAE